MDRNALVCPQCHKYAYGREMDELARNARSLAALGQLAPARDQWAEVLRLLPPNTSESRAVQREIDRLNARLTPKPATDWKKKLGPLGVGVAALIKYKTALLLLLTKGKYLFSLVLYFSVYWAMFGWWFAFGFTVSIFLHEMGHFVFARASGYAAEWPMFVPFFGAYVRWNGADADPHVRARIALAGPLFGMLSGVLAYAVFLSTQQPVWLAIAHFAGWINLLQLIPVFIFDGASALHALNQQSRWAILAVSLAMFFIVGEFLFLLIAIATAYRIYKRDAAPVLRQRIALAFIALLMSNGFLSWFAQNQARVLIGR